ncbi:MAG: efflux RND transporter periplasmic adaptor subunit [Cyclobacteriaceae bacterium]
MNKINTLIVLALTLGLLACKENKNKERTIIPSETIAVKTYQLKNFESPVKVICTGMLTTEKETKYGFKTGGVINRIYVTEGQSFKKGSLLATLRIDEIEAGFVQAQLGLEKAERDLRRTTNLFEDSVATLEQLQNSKTAFEVAKKQLEAVAFNKEYASIHATSDGFITKKLANEGEVIAGGMPVLATNQNGHQAWVLKTGVSDKDWARIEIGNRAKIQLDAYPELSLNGTVYQKSQAADQGSGSFQIEIKVALENLEPALGMFGKAEIETNTIQKYQSIPYDALIEADGKYAFVFVPESEGKVRKHAIEIASFDNTEVNVRSGLETIKEVILTNTAFLNENSTITIIK